MSKTSHFSGACEKDAHDTLLKQGGPIALIVNSHTCESVFVSLLTPLVHVYFLTWSWTGNVFSQCAFLTSASYLPLLACCYGRGSNYGCSSNQSATLLPVKAWLSGHVNVFHPHLNAGIASPAPAAIMPVPYQPSSFVSCVKSDGHSSVTSRSVLFYFAV